MFGWNRVIVRQPEIEGGIDIPSELNVLAAQVAGVASIVTMCRFQIENKFEFSTDSLYALEQQLESINFRLNEVSDYLANSV